MLFYAISPPQHLPSLDIHFWFFDIESNRICSLLFALLLKQQLLLLTFCRRCTRRFGLLLMLFAFQHLTCRSCARSLAVAAVSPRSSQRKHKRLACAQSFVVIVYLIAMAMSTLAHTHTHSLELLESNLKRAKILESGNVFICIS